MFMKRCYSRVEIVYGNLNEMIIERLTNRLIFDAVVFRQHCINENVFVAVKSG